MTLSFKQLSEDPRFTIATKPWYGKYPFRITFLSHGWDGSLFDSGWKERYFRNRSIIKLLDENEEDFRFRNDRNFNIYLKSLESVNYVLSEYSDIILHITGPISQQHSELMMNDLTQSFRDKLFYNQFKYKVSAQIGKWTGDMDKFLEMSEFVINSFEKNNYYLNSTLKRYPYWKELEELHKNSYSYGRSFQRIPYSATGTVYLKEYDDVCAMHMVFKDIITSTTKVVLIEDLE